MWGRLSRSSVRWLPLTTAAVNREPQFEQRSGDFMHAAAIIGRHVCLLGRFGFGDFGVFVIHTPSRSASSGTTVNDFDGKCESIKIHIVTSGAVEPRPQIGAGSGRLVEIVRGQGTEGWLDRLAVRS